MRSSISHSFNHSVRPSHHRCVLAVTCPSSRRPGSYGRWQRVARRCVASGWATEVTVPKAWRGCGQQPHYCTPSAEETPEQAPSAFGIPVITQSHAASRSVRVGVSLNLLHTRTHSSAPPRCRGPLAVRRAGLRPTSRCSCCCRSIWCIALVGLLQERSRKSTAERQPGCKLAPIGDCTDTACN